MAKSVSCRKRKPSAGKRTPSRFTKVKVLAAVQGSGGIMSSIAARLDCDWHTAAKYVSMYAETRAALDMEAERLLDNAEGALHNLIAQGDSSMIRYFLSTKGKKRGYGDEKKVDITTNGKELMGRIEIVDKTDLVQ